MGAYLGWSLDLIRKINEHSKFRRWILKLVLGKLAWRELVGLRDSLKKDYDVNFQYDCKDCDYHKEKVNW